MTEKTPSLSLVKIRPVEMKDAPDLTELYRRLDTCNGEVSQVKVIIQASRASLMSQRFESLTLVAEALSDDLAPLEVVATARLILLGAEDPEQAPLMYEETEKGLELIKRSTNPSLEMAAMVTKSSYEGQGIGKALTAVRAILARTFSGLIGTDRILVEFVPNYEDQDSKENAFWRDLILARLIETNTLDAAMKKCSALTSKKITTPDELLKVLIKLPVGTRNVMIKEYFPSLIPADKITSDARKVTGDVGAETKGALINLQRTYGSGTFVQTGTFPIDGGPNYETSAHFGALGDRTVRTTYTDGSVEDAKVMTQSAERLIVWAPKPPTQRALRDSSWVMTPGILGPKVVKLPIEVSGVTNVGPNEETSIFRLPLASSKKT